MLPFQCFSQFLSLLGPCLQVLNAVVSTRAIFLRGIHKQLRIPCYKASAKVQLGRGLLQQCYLRQMEGLTTLHGGRLRMMSSSTVLGMTFTLSPLLNCLELPTRGRMSFLPICFTTFLHGRCEGCRVYWQLCWSSFIYAIESTHRRVADTGAKQVNGHRKWKESHFNAVMRALQRARKRVQLHGQTTYKGRIVTAADIGYPGQHHLPIAAMPETSKAPPQARDGMARILAPWPPLLGPCAESFSQPLRKGQLAALSFNLGGFSKAGFDEFQTWLNSDNVVSHVHLIYAYRRRGVPLRNLPVRHGTGCSLAFRSLSVRGWPSWSTKSLAPAHSIRFAELVKGRLLKVQLAADATHHLRRKPITIFSIYQRARVSAQAVVYEKRERLWDHVNKAFASVPGRHLFLAGGDFNTPLAQKDHHVGSGVTKSVVVPQDADRFASLLVDHGLTAMNTWRRPQATYVGDDFGTQIDFLLTRTSQAGRSGRAACAIIPHIHLASWRHGARHVPVAALLTDTHAECRARRPPPQARLSRDHMVQCLRTSAPHQHLFQQTVQQRLEMASRHAQSGYLLPHQVDEVLNDVSLQMFAAQRKSYSKPWQSAEVQLSLKSVWDMRAQLRQRQRAARPCAILLHLSGPSSGSSGGSEISCPSSPSRSRTTTIAGHCLRHLFVLWRDQQRFSKLAKALQRTSVTQRRAKWDAQLEEAEGALYMRGHSTVMNCYDTGRGSIPVCHPGEWELQAAVEVTLSEVETALSRVPPRKAMQPGRGCVALCCTPYCSARPRFLTGHMEGRAHFAFGGSHRFVAPLPCETGACASRSV